MKAKKPPTHDKGKRNRTIWALAKDLGINSEYLHVLVFSITQSESVGKLNLKQQKEVIAHLKNEQAKRNRTQSRLEADGKVFRMPTPSQRYFLNRILSEISQKLNLKSSEAYLNSVSERMFKKTPDRLDRREFGNLIRQLRRITESAKAAEGA